MINLLNPAEQKQIRAARINVRLRRFVLLTFAALVIFGGIYLFSIQRAGTENEQAKTSRTEAEKKLVAYADVNKTANEYRANLAVAKKILSSEIVFSTFITDLAATMPPNTILEGLTLSSKALTTDKSKPTVTELRARTKSYEDALTLKTKLEQKTTLFSDVRITTITRLETGLKGPAAAYPYSVGFSVVIVKQGATQ
jgi:hypothetical protein